MFKKVFSSILISIFLVFSGGAAVNVKAETAPAPGGNQFTVSIDGKSIPSKYVQPYQDSNSVVMVSLNVFCERLSGSLKIKGDSAEFTTPDYAIKLENNNKNVSVNSKNVTLSTTPIIRTNFVFVPLEFFSEILNKTVNWDSSTRTVKISTPEKVQPDQENSYTSRKLDNYLSTLQSTDNFHGSVLVAQNGKIILNKGYGKSDFEQNIQNTQDTTFPIGSMTKQFTAMAIMQLVEKGLIDVNDPLSKYIPDFPNGNEITIENLLTHSSGIVNCTNLPEFWSMSQDSLKDINNVINLFKNKPLEFKPGTSFSYSNSGYILLGYIVTKVSGMSYEDYLQKNIFQPLDMENTGLGYKGTEKMYSSTGYSGYLDVYPVSDETTLNGAYGAGCLYSSTGDLYKWDRALYTEKLVKKSTLDNIFSNHMEMTPSGPYYGYGWMLTNGKYGREIYHGGNTVGFTSNIARYPDKDLTIIILTNVGYYNINPLNDTLADIALGGNYTLPKAKRVITLDGKTLDRYVGNYKLQDNLGNISITTDGKALYYEQNNSGEKYQLYAQSKDDFFLRITDASIKFNIDGKGTVTGLELYQLGMQFHGDKVK
ncbi:serine hydrolase [Clostridium luticellarii]|jgi:CubicO group peptidase (beta-lactamase class C family)|uniref:serine hydrolase n=1 Tax=Clostridium luticellarii TaxID=1691940 RepID=UPI0023564689|nr:serine hydrolase [Clostridium luticellarii]MCI1944040.1 serine hydrolase [Clostridium luticellarii]MCI1967318.1 serine hydrolase [Clostridium luticellarii]MCI1995509.1 serine hydrolase [Clostridium luticellarii]MCI2039196.1 serine hydrolase [Clostridium luticellarii]